MQSSTLYKFSETHVNGKEIQTKNLQRLQVGTNSFANSFWELHSETIRLLIYKHKQSDNTMQKGLNLSRNSWNKVHFNIQSHSQSLFKSCTQCWNSLKFQLNMHCILTFVRSNDSLHRYFLRLIHNRIPTHNECVSWMGIFICTKFNVLMIINMSRVPFYMYWHIDVLQMSNPIIHECNPQKKFVKFCKFKTEMI